MGLGFVRRCADATLFRTNNNNKAACSGIVMGIGDLKLK